MIREAIKSAHYFVPRVRAEINILIGSPHCPILTCDRRSQSVLAYLVVVLLMRLEWGFIRILAFF